LRGPAEAKTALRVGAFPQEFAARMKTFALSELARRTPEPAISWLMKLTLEHPQLISLAAGFTDNDSLPVEETRAVLEKLFSSPRRARPALQYGSTIGDARLRALTVEHVRRCDGGRARANDWFERTIVTHGSQQLLYITTEALCDAGDIVLVEDPTYFVFLGIAQSRGLRCRGVKLAENGIDLEELDCVLDALKRRGELPRLKFLYLVSYFQNPTGRTTAFAKKRAALELLRRYERAAGHPIYLIEDAAYRELGFSGEDECSALGTPFADRVIYAGTYSKPFATGARIGFGILPKEVFTAVARIKGNHDFGTSNLLQQLMAAALESGAYENHLPALRRRYSAKAAAMTSAMEKHFPKVVQWERPRGGLYVWARLPARLKSGVRSKLFRTALKRDVLYVPGELCYCDDASRAKPNNEMRISFGGAKDAEIAPGIARLGAVINELIKSN
jgi:2-aminoadipate transaminase